MFKKKQKYAGFSMLEMLVALLVLSIGLLGVATLQIRGQQFNQVGYLRTQATFLAYDIMERIRINSDNIAGNGNGEEGRYEYPDPTGFTSDGYDPQEACPDPDDIGLDERDCACESDSKNCSPNKDDDPNLTDPDLPIINGNLVEYDLTNWFLLVRETLPDGQARIVWDDTQNQYEITIQWTNIIDRDDDAPNEQQQWILQL